MLVGPPGKCHGARALRRTGVDTSQRNQLLALPLEMTSFALRLVDVGDRANTLILVKQYYLPVVCTY